MRKLAFLFLGLFILSGCSARTLRVIGQPKSVRVIRSDTTWEGIIIVKGAIFVPQGVTLTIQPGTIIRFEGQPRETDELKRHDIIDGAGLKVEGTVKAKGSAQFPIFFTSNKSKPQPGDWDKILLNHSQNSFFNYCYFEYADFAFHAHFSQTKVQNSVIRRNNEGFRLGESRFTITNNRIVDNHSRGINSRACQNKIIRNDITNNVVGIFLYEKNQGSVIEENNIYNNKDYDLRMGDFHAQDITLRNNWWNSTNINIIGTKIWDNADDENIGRVFIQPATHTWEIKQ